MCWSWYGQNIYRTGVGPGLCRTQSGFVAFVLQRFEAVSPLQLVEEVAPWLWEEEEQSHKWHFIQRGPKRN